MTLHPPIPKIPSLIDRLINREQECQYKIDALEKELEYFKAQKLAYRVARDMVQNEPFNSIKGKIIDHQGISRVVIESQELLSPGNYNLILEKQESKKE